MEPFRECAGHSFPAFVRAKLVTQLQQQVDSDDAFPRQQTKRLRPLAETAVGILRSGRENFDIGKAFTIENSPLQNAILSETTWAGTRGHEHSGPRIVYRAIATGAYEVAGCEEARETLSSPAQIEANGESLLVRRRQNLTFD